VNVVCPADGTVRYAGPIRGLDHGIVVDHGDYYTIVGKLAELAIPAGTKLVRGDRIGHPARQRVYFEVRVKVGPGGLPIDPQPLLARD
jgi:septal ring factor EnvC (AmiA/AmiB activator)